MQVEKCYICLPKSPGGEEGVPVTRIQWLPAAGVAPGDSKLNP